nr:class I SAM-dependent methyltransferase [uncultured Methanoregula sp.]
MQISHLITTLHQPPLYEQGNASMWEDDHISRHLLELHLNPDCDAASRKRSTIEKTIQWIGTFTNTEKKSILDLGCGPGLYCELLAEAGHDLTGVDFSKRSITYAKESAGKKGLRIEYLRKNYLDLSFENRFDLAMMIFCDFDVLVPADRTRLLENIYQALKPGGLFIFDTLNGKAPAAMKIPGKFWEAADRGFWKNCPYLCLSETFHYEDARVILQQHTVCSDQDQPSVYRFWTHYYEHGMLASILDNEGFTIESTCDDLLPDNGSGTQDMVTFYVARKR